MHVTVYGKPSAAVLLAPEDVASLEETIEILADTDTDVDAMPRLHELALAEVESREDLAAGLPRWRGQRW